MDLMYLVGMLAILVIIVIVAYFLLNQVQLDPVVRRVINIGLVVVAAVIVIWVIASITGVGSVRVGP